MGFKEELEAIQKESGINNRDLWSCLQNCYDHNLGQGCCDACYANNPSAVTAETKARVKALMERHAAKK
jgi:hypothetical protein